MRGLEKSTVYQKEKEIVDLFILMHLLYNVSWSINFYKIFSVTMEHVASIVVWHIWNSCWNNRSIRENEHVTLRRRDWSNRSNWCYWWSRWRNKSWWKTWWWVVLLDIIDVRCHLVFKILKHVTKLIANLSIFGDDKSWRESNVAFLDKVCHWAKVLKIVKITEMSMSMASRERILIIIKQAMSGAAFISRVSLIFIIIVIAIFIALLWFFNDYFFIFLVVVIATAM